MQSLTPTSQTTLLARGDALLSQLQQTQRQLADTRRQINTGEAFSRPSGAPDKVSTVSFLERRLAERDQQASNLRHAGNVLDTADQALGQSADLLRESISVASRQIGVGSNAQQRKAEAAVIQNQLESLVDAGNRRYAELSTFGGRNGTPIGEPVFESFLGGIRYRGARQNLHNQVGPNRESPFTSNGLEAFDALSARVTSDVDLSPQATAETLLSQVGGTSGEGVTKGAVRATVNGTEVTADLNDADSLGDVVTRVNEAIDSINSSAGSLSISGNGFTLSSSGGSSITIEEQGEGDTAQSLGIALNASGGPATDTGPSVNRHLALTTPLTDLGASVDLTSGLRITQGQQTTVVDFSGASNIEDLANRVKDADLGLRLEINEQGSGLNLISDVSGITLSVGENGGTTAADLGLRTFDTTTNLSDFHFGRGIETLEGEDDIAISLHNGTTFNVNLSGSSEIGDVITAIESQASAAGLAVGSDFDVRLAATGNGLVFEDTTSGPNDFAVANSGLSQAGSELGIVTNAGGANTFTSEDHAQVRVENAFTHLGNLRDALDTNDTSGITLAGDGLEQDLDQIISARGLVGARAKAIEDQKTRSEDQKLSEQTILSELKDADLTQVITRFTQLQTQLQASLQVASQQNQLSLLDFLR